MDLLKAAPQPIDPRLAVGPVALTVQDLDRAVDFYTSALGFQANGGGGNTAALGAGERVLLHLTGNPKAPHNGSGVGLYHFAILVPDRLELAGRLRHLVSMRVPLQGAADHAFSEAVYLADPEGNGIEIYRDRPRDEWPTDSARVRNLPLDSDGLLAELDGDRAPSPALPPRTVIGHVHLHVADVHAAERFYNELLGLDVTMRVGGTASFLSGGGYHHHVAVNTWSNPRAAAAPRGALGLDHFTLSLPDPEAVAATVGRIERAGGKVEGGTAGPLVRDPSGNAFELVAA